MEQLLGWSASIVLLATLICQVVKQWRSRSVEGVSPWLFAGQLTASTAFVAYSWLVENWVFVVTNAAILVTAIAGQVVYRRNVRVAGD
ncbi:PQ-loop repeat-containing protein [Alkalisalibacterium limincola]|uniref:PQ-loop repeat-containing protein n=1 Tax=Alkalisalibacterium limincola TaxID=2699169 RepID=A0A5C8KMB9_9GAMM|nr:PQ-loop repeat-containing protein [Alkalisalibacterium limincola]TXK61036.1 PQ-loop repeat-containing protein [Alkalisalibacterium limincola]